METSSCLKQFARYASMSVLGMVGVSCYILADTFFVSQGLGTNGLAALNLAVPVYNFIHGSGLMLGMGGAIKYSICKSSGGGDGCNTIFTNTVYLAVLLAAVFMTIGIFFSTPLAVFLGADGSVLEMTETYLHWLLMFAPSYMLNDVFLMFVRNDGNPRRPMFAMLTGSIINILLDYLFIFPLQMGIFGAVLATCMSPFFSMFVLLPYRIKKKNGFHITKTALYPHLAGQILSLGFPSLLAEVSSGIVMITFNMLILKLEGNTGVAAYGVVANISLVVVAVYTGISQGVQPLVSRFYGTKEMGDIKYTMHLAFVTMFVVSVLIYLFLFFAANPVSSVFNSEHDAHLQEIAVTGLRLYFTSNVFAGFNIILSVCFTSMDNPIPAHVLSLLRGLFLIIPAAFLMAFFGGMTGVWMAYPFTEAVVAVIGYFVYKIMLRKN